MTVQIPADRIAAAQADPGKWHIPPSSKLAQDGVESAFGRFEPANSNNPFGIQRLTGLPFVSAASHEFRNGVLVPVVEEFSQFKSLADAYYEHDKLIATNPVYAPAMAFVGNYVKFIETFGPHYATAPNYVKTLLALIDEDGLAKYDNLSPTDALPVPAPIARTVAHLTPLVSIKSVQDALNWLGAATPPLAIDGKYGVLTRAAVRKFQSWSGLAVDGDVGPLTIAALAKAAARPVQSAAIVNQPAAPAAPASPPAPAPPPVTPLNRVIEIQSRMDAVGDAVADKDALSPEQETWFAELEDHVVKFFKG